MLNYGEPIAWVELLPLLSIWNEGNLSQYSNQGWEAFNGKLKNALARKTQRGGHAGAGAATEPLVKAAFRFSLRSIVHLFYPDTEELSQCIEAFEQQLIVNGECSSIDDEDNNDDDDDDEEEHDDNE